MDHYFLTLINGGGPLCTVHRLTAQCDEALSNFAFNVNLRRYTMGAYAYGAYPLMIGWLCTCEVGRCRFTQ